MKARLEIIVVVVLAALLIVIRVLHDQTKAGLFMS